MHGAGRRRAGNDKNVYSSLKEISIDDTVKHFEDSNYGTLKREVADLVVSRINDIQTKYNEIINSNIIDEVLDEGAKKMNKYAKKKYEEVLKKVGLGR